MKSAKQGILVRVGIDQAYGRWNAPVDADSREFFYVPIPESSSTRFYPGMGRRFHEVLPSIDAFARNYGLDGQRGVKWPEELNDQYMHLDPDFEYLTYGNRGNSRGTRIANLKRDDLVVFFAGMKPIRPTAEKLSYAIIGLFVVDEVVPASEVPRERWVENAHTRKSTRGQDDVVVRARPSVSGRLAHCIPIGEFRDKAYRVRRDLLKAWGGLSVNDGYVQRSAVPPMFLDAERFYRWFRQQKPRLIASNFGRDQRARKTHSASPVSAAKRFEPSRCITKSRKKSLHPPARHSSTKHSREDQIGAEAGVFIVHLRQPRMNDRHEMRSDPYYEFGSFGCTGCHSRNIMKPRNVESLIGARIGFAQGGRGEFRLILSTPPVKEVVQNQDRCEIRWNPTRYFRFNSAPLLISNEGRTEFPALYDSLRGVDRSTHCGGFSSAFRSRCRPIADHVAAEIIEIYDNRDANAAPNDFARSYDDAMQLAPPRVDRDRRKSYEASRCEGAGLGSPTRTRCRVTRATKRSKC